MRGIREGLDESERIECLRSKNISRRFIPSKVPDGEFNYHKKRLVDD